MTANKKGKASQPITKNKNKKKEKKKKRRVHISFIGAGMEKVYKAPLLCSNMTLFRDQIYGNKFPEEYKDQLFLYMFTKYDFDTKEFTVKYKNTKIKEDGVYWVAQDINSS